MKTRRDFLAAIGLGAGASALGLPGMAQACGGRRRRSRGCSNECGHCDECASSSPQHPAMVPYQTLCSCCCPKYLYATDNTTTPPTWWYFCNCCPLGSGTKFAPSTFQYDLNHLPTCSTNKSACIGTACATFSPDHKRASNLPIEFGDFFLDPDAKDKNGKYHAATYKDGLTAPKPKDFKVGLGKNASLKKTTTVKYNDGSKDRIVSLHDISYQGGPDLNIGFQVSEDPGGTTTIEDLGIPSKVRLPYCHLVYAKGNCYLVALAK